MKVFRTRFSCRNLIRHHQLARPTRSHQLPRAEDAVHAIAQGLHKLYSCIASSGRVPEQWRTALLVPIYKSRDQAADVANYRPLSMLTVACRLWSSIMNQQLMAATKAIPSRQHVWLQTRPALR